MNLPPVDLSYLHEKFCELAARVQEVWEASSHSGDDMDMPVMLREAMSQLIAILDHVHAEEPSDTPEPAEINTLCEYGLQLLEDLSRMAAELEQPMLASEIERLSLPCALWFARRGGEIRQLTAVVNALAFFANQSSDPQAMARLYTQCCELIDATSPT